MDKVSKYVKRILALGLSSAAILLPLQAGLELTTLAITGLATLSSLLFAYLDYRINGEKPRFLFGMNQSDAYLNGKGGFWSMFKWIVHLVGFIYDLLVWAIWGIFLLFNLIVDLLILIKTVLFWIVHAVIWFIRQLFPPFVFLFKVFIHYLLLWPWWIYQVAVRNVKVSVNSNFYFIALWGAIPAVFIIFLFYVLGEIASLPGLLLLSGVFAIVPIVWSFGEIAALRYEKREKDEYVAVRYGFGNGFDVLRSVLFYLLIAFILIALEVILNLLGWIPNISMSLVGITLNLNMAISLVMIFLAVIIVFAASMLPTHILYHPEHENDLTSTIRFLKVIGRRFLRYVFAGIPGGFFSALLLVIPLGILFLAAGITDNAKNNMLDVRIAALEKSVQDQEPVEAYRNQIRINRLEMYAEIPFGESAELSVLLNQGEEITIIEERIEKAGEELLDTRSAHSANRDRLDSLMRIAASSMENDSISEEMLRISEETERAEASYASWEKAHLEGVEFIKLDLKEAKSIRWQTPILILFIGIFIAVFGGMAFAVLIMYFSNVYYDLYTLREDGEPTYWQKTIQALHKKDNNQPLLGFTFLVLIIVPVLLFLFGVI